MSKYLKVSESVCAGHPDKLADQISDAILDATISKDKNAKVAIETLLANNTIVLAGEIATSAKVDYENIARQTIQDNGYTNDSWGFSYKSDLINRIHHQSPDIAIGVEGFGAGDQGLMYGYAINETTEFMPLPITIAHKICKKIDEVRNNKELDYLRPDGKSQVVIEYKDNIAVGIKHVTVAVPHETRVGLNKVTQDIKSKILKPILNEFNFNLPQDIVINGTGVWHLPGPSADVGLTGRKIVVDTYGGASKVGGGAFSGKDPSKVDRSGAYAARYIAKNIVANGLAKQAEVCLAYYIGAKKPIIQTIDTFRTNSVSIDEITKYADKLLDTSVKGIIEHFKLLQPIYSQTSAYGHFGKAGLPWEQVTDSIKSISN